MKGNMAVPPPAGTLGSERPHSDSSGSGPVPAAGGPPPGDRAGSADRPRPAAPLAPTPGFSPRSAGPGLSATGWKPPPCAGQWGKRPAGPGHHGGTPGEGTKSGPARGRQGPRPGLGHLTTATNTSCPSGRAWGRSSRSRRGPAGWPRNPGPAMSTQPDAELSPPPSLPQPHLPITSPGAPPQSRSRHASWELAP